MGGRRPPRLEVRAGVGWGGGGVSVCLGAPRYSARIPGWPRILLHLFIFHLYLSSFTPGSRGSSSGSLELMLGIPLIFLHPCWASRHSAKDFKGAKVTSGCCPDSKLNTFGSQGSRDGSLEFILGTPSIFLHPNSSSPSPEIPSHAPYPLLSPP